MKGLSFIELHQYIAYSVNFPHAEIRHDVVEMRHHRYRKTVACSTSQNRVVLTCILIP